MTPRRLPQDRSALEAVGPGFPSRWSPCRRYRYVLWRRWGAPPYLMVVGLNPSTADDTKEDPTLRRCISFAKREGMGALCMTNVYAWRSTDPRQLAEVGFALALGTENRRWLAECGRSAGLIICAWGKRAQRMDAEATLKLLHQCSSRVFCLGVNRDGTPKHPLYLGMNSPLRVLRISAVEGGV